MFEITIKGKFVTGTTIEDEEQAKEATLNLLKKMLKEASLLGPSQVFEFYVESVEAGPLGGSTSSFEFRVNPLVALTLWFKDGAALRQVFSNPVPQVKAMAALGHIVAELGGELNIQLEG
ncbi:MAG: hypothetical protein Q7T57_06690 [Dehalococcoidales bacterium]|nr:hypothetical protein [Dehalococcoidales bacterium]